MVREEKERGEIESAKFSLRRSLCFCYDLVVVVNRDVLEN